MYFESIDSNKDFPDARFLAKNFLKEGVIFEVALELTFEVIKSVLYKKYLAIVLQKDILDKSFWSSSFLIYID